MADVEMRLEGFDQLRAQLRDLSQTQADRMLGKALRAGAAVFKEDEERRAPERPVLPSGTALPPGALKRDVIVKKVRGQNVYLIGPGKYTSRAAHLVEMGHRMVRGGRNRLMKNGTTKGPGTVVGMVPPHPYIRPTFEGSQQEAVDAVAESLQADLSKLNFRKK